MACKRNKIQKNGHIKNRNDLKRERTFDLFLSRPSKTADLEQCFAKGD